MKNITLNFKHSSSALIFSYSVNVWLAIKLLHWGIYNSPCKTCTSFVRSPVKIWLRNQIVQSKLISIIFAEQNEHSNPSERIGLCRAFTTTFNRRRLCPKRTMLSLSLLLEYQSQFSHWGDFSCNFCCNFNRRSQVIFGPALLIKKAFCAVVFHLFQSVLTSTVIVRRACDVNTYHVSYRR